MLAGEQSPKVVLAEVRLDELTFIETHPFYIGRNKSWSVSDHTMELSSLGTTMMKNGELNANRSEMEAEGVSMASQSGKNLKQITQNANEIRLQDLNQREKLFFLIKCFK